MMFRHRSMAWLRLLLSIASLALPACRQTATVRNTADTASSAWSEEKAASFFWTKGYEYCDAKPLASLWGVDVYQAKVRAGRLMLDDRWDELSNEQQRAIAHADGRPGAACQFYETGYSYEDAEFLAGAWGMSISEAKAHVEWKVLQQQRWVVDEELKAAWADEYQQDWQPGGWQFFLDKGYDWCDAKMLAAVWGVDPSEAKQLAGDKLWNMGYEPIEAELTAARNHVNSNAPHLRCTWSDVGYSFEDAEVVAQQWGITVVEAKGVITDKVNFGLEHLLPDSIRRR